MQKSTVVILGAGSSNDFGFPLGSEVWDYLNQYNVRNTKVLEQSYYRVRNFMNDIYPGFTIGVSKQPTFEEVLSAVVNSMKEKGSMGDYEEAQLRQIQEDLESLYYEIIHERCHWCIYPFVPQNDDCPETLAYNNYKLYQKYIKRLILKTESIAFISLNYDLLLDYVLMDRLEKLGKDFTYGIDTYDFYNQTVLCRTSGLLLLKPHGSLNLSTCKNCNKIYYLEDSFKRMKENSKIEKEDAKRRCSCGNEIELLLIPPLKGKNISNYPYPFDKISKKMKEVISYSSKIILIGYSFPDYDADIRDNIIKPAIKNNTSQREIVVITETKDKIYYEEILGPIRDTNFYTEGFISYIMNAVSN